MKTFFRWMLTSTLLLILILVAAPFLVPMDAYKPELEERLSRLMHQQVMIGSLKLQMLPTVELKADGISIWSKGTGSGEIFVKTMHLTPDLPLLLFERTLSIRHIKLEGLATNQRFIKSTISKITRHNTEDRPFAILDRISAKRVTIRLDDGRMLGPYRFNVSLTPDYNVSEVRMGRMDKAVDMILSSETSGYRIFINAANWTLPLSPALHFDQFQASGILIGNRLQFSQIESHIYNGSINGSADISWGQRWRVTAKLKTASVQMAPIISLFKGGGFQGSFSGDLDVLLAANRADQLLENPLVTGDFSIADGVVLNTKEQRQLFVFDQFSAYGKLRRHYLETKRSQLSAYNGTVSGDTKISWRPRWTFAANLEANTIDTEKLLAGFYDQKFISGDLSGQATVKLSGNTFTGMFASPLIEGRLQLSQGAIYTTPANNPGTVHKIFEFEEIRSAGRLSQDTLETHESEILAYGGLIRGTSRTAWRSGWNLNANLETQSINIEKLLAKIYRKKYISGNLSGQATVKLSGDTFSGMLETPIVEGKIQLSQGAIYTSTTKSKTHESNPMTPADNPGIYRKLFEFEKISSAGRLSQDTLETHESEIFAYGGLIRGTSQTSWHSGWIFNANLEAQSINTEILLGNIVDEKTISGNFYGNTTIKLSGTTFTNMLDKPDIQSHFRVTNGILYKADLEKASMSLTESSDSQGQTGFSELRGEAQIKNGTIQLDDIKITSSVIQATGNLNIDNTKNLHGEINVGLRKTATLISIPLKVSGTSNEPRLRPTSTALLGGMVGTTILGPGVGTALGIKVGESMGKFVTAISKPSAANQQSPPPD